MIFTATVSVLSGLKSAPAAFAGDSRFVISEKSAPTIFSSQVSIDMVGALRSIPNITAASPEIFAFTNWNGVSFVVRGIGDGFGDVGNPAWPSTATDSSDAIIGSRLLDKLGAQLPCSLLLVGSYTSRMAVVNVTGSFETDKALDDELLVHIDIARFLSGMPKDQVSIIRVATTQPGWLSNLLSPESARFTLYDLSTDYSALAPGPSVPGQTIAVSVGVRNWGSKAGSTQVQFLLDGHQYGDVPVDLNSSASTVVTLHPTLDRLGVHTIEVAISGDFPVRLSKHVTVVEPYMEISAPSKVLLGRLFNVSVTTHSTVVLGSPEVFFDSQSDFTDAGDIATFNASHAGSFQIVSNLTSLENASATITVVDPASYPSVFGPVIASFALSTDSMLESQRAQGIAVVENNGTISGSYDLHVLLDSALYKTVTVHLDAMGSATVSFTIEGVDPGEYIVQVGTFSRGLEVQPFFADNTGLVQLVIRYGSSEALSSSSSLPIYQAAKISQGNIAVALFAIGAISALLAGLAITSVFATEVRQSRRKLGVLKTIGASRAAIRALVLPQALENGLAGAALGIAFGVLLVEWLSGSGLFVIFGHEFTLDVNSNLLVLVLLGAVGISVLSAMASAAVAVRETAIKSIRNLEDEPAPPIDVDRILGDR